MSNISIKTCMHCRSRYIYEEEEVSGSPTSGEDKDDLLQESDIEFIDDAECETRADKLRKVRDLRRKRLEDDAGELALCVKHTPSSTLLCLFRSPWESEYWRGGS